MDYSKLCGVRPSPADYRDYRLERIIAGASVPSVFPDEFELELPPNFPIVQSNGGLPQNGGKQYFSQGTFAMCFAYVLALLAMMKEHEERGTWTWYSPGYAYARRKPSQYQGEGMVGREGLEIAREFGIPRFDDFRNLAKYAELRKVLPFVDLQWLDLQAAPQRIAAFAAIRTVDEIKAALTVLKTPVIYVVPFYDSFLRGGDLPKPDTATEHYWGGHATLIRGWTRDRRWQCVHSALSHRFTAPWDYPAQEIWSVTDQKPEDPCIILEPDSSLYAVSTFPVTKWLSQPTQGAGDEMRVLVKDLAPMFGYSRETYEDGHVRLTPPR